MRNVAAGVRALLFGTVALAGLTGTPAVRAEDLPIRIAGADRDVELRLLHHASGRNGRSTAEVVLMLHPYGVPTATAFDVPGFSWMEDLADRGFDVWAMDLRGFGGSTRPGGTGPVARASDAVRDVYAVIVHITEGRRTSRVHLVGWSWGGVVASMVAAAHPDRVDRLVLLGAMHGFKLPLMTQPLEDPTHAGQLNPNLPAYQVIEPARALGHWRMMLKGIEDVVSDDTIRQVEDVLLASDATSGARQPPAIRRPMGPLVDLYEIWSNRPIYDAGAIRAPTLVIRGDHDLFADPGLAAKLTGATRVREIVVPRATHWVPYEAGRAQVLEETARFLKGS